MAEKKKTNRKNPCRDGDFLIKSRKERLKVVLPNMLTLICVGFFGVRFEVGGGWGKITLPPPSKTR